MARQDYAQPKRRSGGAASRSANRKPQPRARKSAPAPRRKPWGLALIVIIALAGLGYLLMQLVHHSAAPPRQTLAIPAKPAAPKPTPKTATATPKHAKPAETDAVPSRDDNGNRFQFYDMLPKSQVKTPAVSAYKSTPKNAKLDSKILLQTGSFRHQSDADKMRAKMILAGLPNVTTSRTDGSNGVWYRVRTGPFDTRAEVDAANAKLYKLNIEPLEIHE